MIFCTHWWMEEGQWWWTFPPHDLGDTKVATDRFGHQPSPAAKAKQVVKQGTKANEQPLQGPATFEDERVISKMELGEEEEGGHPDCDLRHLLCKGLRLLHVWLQADTRKRAREQSIDSTLQDATGLVSFSFSRLLQWGQPWPSPWLQPSLWPLFGGARDTVHAWHTDLAVWPDQAAVD